MDGAKRASVAGQPARSFDPRPHVRTIESRRGETAEYLDVKWRLVWLRTEHPDARISTEHVQLTDELAVFRATIELSEGGSASGYGSQSSRNFPEFIEAAETKAIGRALAALGFGTQFALEADAFNLDEAGENEIGGESDLAGAVAPVELRPSSRAPQQAEPKDSPSPTGEQPMPAPRADTSDRDMRPSERRDRPVVEVLSPVPKPAAEAAPVLEGDSSGDDDRADEFDPANYSWNQFWYWARGLGYNSKAGLEELLGVHNLTAHTPREAREMLRAYRSEQGLD